MKPTRCVLPNRKIVILAIVFLLAGAGCGVASTPSASTPVPPIASEPPADQGIPVIQSVELESNGKEIHLEILSKLAALGYNIKEIPATLRARKKGRSKFRLKATALSHLRFSFYERPMMVFGLLGAFSLVFGFIIGVFLLAQYWHGRLNPDRPLMTVLVVLLLGGVQILAFGFLAIQILALRKEIYILQRENKQIQSKLKNPK